MLGKRDVNDYEYFMVWSRRLATVLTYCLVFLATWTGYCIGWLL